MSFKGALLKPGEKGERRNGTSRSIAKGSRYEVLKEKIRGWWDDRLKIGEALREIQEGKLYQAEYQTFDDFCEEEYGLKRAQAYGLISAVNVKSTISSPVLAGKIVNERQMRALSSVPIERRDAVIAEVAKNGAITAKAITEAAKTKETLSAMPDKKISKNGTSPKEPHRDKTNFTIPEEIYSDWQRADSYVETLRTISKIKTTLETALEDKDIVFAEVNNTTIATLKNAYGDLKRVLPYAVCTTCQGRSRAKCTFCRGRGWLSEFLYKTAVPEQVKSIREKATK